MYYAGAAIFFVVIGFVIGMLLYQAAERHHRRGWVWGIFGFFFNVFTWIAFRLMVGPVVKQ